MNTIIKKLLLITDPKVMIQTGFVPDEKGAGRYVITALLPLDKQYVLWQGNRLPLAMAAITPMVVNTALGATKVFYASQPLHGEDPQSWFERNNDRICATNGTANQVYHQWEAFDDHIYYGYVHKNEADQFLQGFTGTAILPAAVTVPLWNLALLYGRLVPNDFIIWKIMRCGSIIGLVRRGRLEQVCHFWPDLEDIADTGSAIAESLALLLKSLIKENRVTGVIPYSDIDSFSLPHDFRIAGFDLKKPPAIPDVPLAFHEAYACSLHLHTTIDFASDQAVIHAASLKKKRHQYLLFMRIAAVIIMGFFFIIGLSMGAAQGMHYYFQGKLQPYIASVQQIQQKKKTVDSLSHIFQTTAQVLNRRSVITAALTDLQTVFPEGMWLDQYTIEEQNDRQWHSTMFVYSYSTATLPRFMTALETIKGIDSVAMVYSERTTMENKEAVIRLKIESEWNP